MSSRQDETVAMPGTPESQAPPMPVRILWPFPLVAPGIIALRVGHGACATEVFTSDLALWFAGASLLFAGLLIIAVHRCWSSVAAVAISLFGRTLGISGGCSWRLPR
jgi:hypothetical protein